LSVPTPALPASRAKCPPTASEKEPARARPPEYCWTLDSRVLKLRSDERPVLDTLRRRGNHQATAPRFRELPHPLQGTQAKQVAADNDPELMTVRLPREPRTAAEQPERARRQDRARRRVRCSRPGSAQGTDQNERPIDQESEQSEPDRKLDDVVSGQVTGERFSTTRLHLGAACCRQATGRSRAIVLIQIKRRQTAPASSADADRYRFLVCLHMRTMSEAITYTARELLRDGSQIEIRALQRGMRPTCSLRSERPARNRCSVASLS